MREVSRRRRDDGLSRADVALQEPVHSPAAAHTLDYVGYSLLLRPREFEGQSFGEIGQLAGLHGVVGMRRVYAPAVAYGEGMHKKLVEDESAPRLVSARHRAGEMHVVPCVELGTHTAALADIFGHYVGDRPFDQVERPLHSLAERVLREPIGERVDGYDKVGGIRGEYQRGIHLAAHEGAADLPVEDVILALLQPREGVLLIEEGDGDIVGIVGENSLADRHALPHMSGRELRRDPRSEHVRLFPADEGIPYRGRLREVYIIPRAVLKQVVDGVYPDLCKHLGFLRAHALDVGNVSFQPFVQTSPLLSQNVLLIVLYHTSRDFSRTYPKNAQSRPRTQKGTPAGVPFRKI